MRGPDKEDAILSIRMTSEEKSTLIRKARETHLSLSEWVRAILLKEVNHAV
jgi:predicted HicB family RNase H-like nuclease